MKNILLTTIAVAALSVSAQAEIVKECFDFGVTSVSPTGSTPSNTELTFTGALTNGDMNSPDISPFTMTSNVGNFAGTTTTSTFSSANGGILTFNGSVGMVTSAAQLNTATGQLPKNDEGCKVVDFSFEQCTVLDETSDTFKKIAELQKVEGNTVFFGVARSKDAINVKDVFKTVRDEKGGTRLEGDTSKIDLVKTNAEFFYTDSAGTVRSLGTDGTQTVFKNFTVCIECDRVNTPEPSSTLLIGLGGVAMLFRRRR